MKKAANIDILKNKVENMRNKPRAIVEQPKCSVL